MTDVVDSQTRSRMMSGIQGRNTKPEMALRKALHKLGFRYRLHSAKLPGRPDLVLPKYRAVIFVHGCFWHRHPGCRYTSTPASNAEFWQTKFNDTVLRDKRILMQLEQMNWRVGIIWECALRKNQAALIALEVGLWLRSESRFLEIPNEPFPSVALDKLAEPVQ